MTFAHFPLLLLIALPVISHSAMAAVEITSDLRVSGFGSTSIARSDNKTPLFLNREITDTTCYDCDTSFGLQFDYDITDDFSASLQWVKRPQDDWSEPEVEWAYLAYDLSEVSIRAGRLRLPLFLASQYYYVAEAYYWTRPPQEVYDSIAGITFYDGGDLTWQRELSDEMTLSMNPFYGSNRTYAIKWAGQEFHYDSELLVGLATDLSGYDYRWHHTYMRAKYRPQLTGQLITANIHALGYEVSWKQWQFMAEGQVDEFQANWYLSTAYSMDDFSFYVTYAQSHHMDPSESVTPGVRYAVTPNVSVNLEYQYMDINSDKADASGLFVVPPATFNEKKDANLVTFMVSFTF